MRLSCTSIRGQNITDDVCKAAKGHQMLLALLHDISNVLLDIACTANFIAAMISQNSHLLVGLMLQVSAGAS